MVTQAEGETDEELAKRLEEEAAKVRIYKLCVCVNVCMYVLESFSVMTQAEGKTDEELAKRLEEKAAKVCICMYVCMYACR